VHSILLKHIYSHAICISLCAKVFAVARKYLQSCHMQLTVRKSLSVTYHCKTSNTVCAYSNQTFMHAPSLVVAWLDCVSARTTGICLCAYVCMCVCMRVSVSVCPRSGTCVYIYVCVCACIHVFVCLIHKRIPGVCVYSCSHAHVCVCLCVFLCVFVCVCVLGVLARKLGVKLA
jgi:hypothetical protein